MVKTSKAPQIHERLPLLANNKGGRHLGVFSAVFLILNRMIGTGIFSIPSGIYGATGSVGLTFVFWIIGGIIMLCGFTVYLEYGLEMPKSGGELNYLDKVYRRPRNLAAVMFAFSGFLLSFSTSNSYAFGLYLQLALGIDEPNESASKYIGLATVFAVILLHGIWPKAGRVAFNSLGFIKVLILLFVALAGLLVLAGVLQVPGGRPKGNFEHMFANDGFGGGLYNWTVALLRISYSYRGWETVNMVMGEVKKPRRTMSIAGPTAIFLIVTLYLLCNLAYFTVIPKGEILDSGVIVAGTFFLKLFGKSAAGRLLPFFICLSNLGNILVVMYASSRVVRSFGEMNLLPFSNVFASTKPFGTPFAGLIVHGVMTAATTLLPPAGDVYDFVIDLSTYPVAYFATAVTVGLVYLHRHSAENNWGVGRGKYRAPNIAMAVFLVANFAMIVFPWVPPKQAHTGALPYYSSPLGALIVTCLSVLYWLWWRKTPGPLRLELYKEAEAEKDPDLSVDSGYASLA